MKLIKSHKVALAVGKERPPSHLRVIHGGLIEIDENLKSSLEIDFCAETAKFTLEHLSERRSLLASISDEDRELQRQLALALIR